MKPRSAVLPILVAAVALTPAAAGAATLTSDRECYGPGETIGLTGTGFTPSGSVAVTTEGRQLGTLGADQAGAIAGSTGAPVVDGKPRIFDYTATDRTDLAITATAPVRVTSLGVNVRPRRGDPTKPRRIAARGFTRGRNLWAHVRRGSKRRNVRIGRLRGACGTVRARRRILSPNAVPGVYEVRFDSRRGYSRTARPQVMFLVTVYRRFRPASVSAARTGERWARVG